MYTFHAIKLESFCQANLPQCACSRVTQSNFGLFNFLMCLYINISGFYTFKEEEIH